MDNRLEHLDEYLSTKAYVRNFVEDELRARDEQPDDEPEVTFSVRLPVTDLGQLENVASYLGQKKTPFASALLRYAIQDAVWALVLAEENNGRGHAVKVHLNQPVELEDGSGVVQSKFFSDGEGEV